MKRFTPFGVLLVFGMIGLLTGEFGLWFPLGIVGAIVVGVVQSRRAKTAAARDEGAGQG